MKKYLLLLFLTCCTFALGYHMFTSAHANTHLASVSNDTELVKELKTELNQGTENYNQVSKDIIKLISEKVSKTLFTIIYK